jgi:cytochrome c oxidase assembly protein subunit 15
MRSRSLVTPQRYAWIAYAALALLTLIVFTGAAVRLTGSGLGCPTWPKCTDTSLGAPLRSHQGIEFGNRLLTGLVGLPCLLAFVGARLRAPYRRDFFLLGLGLCLSVLAQAVLGGITVRTGLNPYTVMAHYLLSMVALIVAVVLVWRVRREQLGDERPVEHPRRLVLGVRALMAFGAVVIVAGTAASAAGPHAGGEGTGDEVVRLDFRGAETLDWLIAGHARLAAVFGVLVVLAYAWARRTGARRLRRPLAITAIMLAVQGVVGNVQYHLELPAELVWIHVALAAVTWNVMVWAVLAAGRPAGAQGPAAATEPAPARATVGV